VIAQEESPVALTGMTDPDELDALQDRLGIRFRNREILAQAMRHRSATLDHPLRSNERLEFLGDSLVGMVICEYLFSGHADWPEGDLAKAKAYLASEPILAEAARGLGLDEAVELSAGEAASGGRNRPSILADAFEALIAAIYLDRGVRASRTIVRRTLKSAMHRVRTTDYHIDFKSRLQEKLQASLRKTPHYRTIAETGADHDKTFTSHVLVGRKVLGEGEGKSKKLAEQAAAKAALDAIV
jgi:ribonuclease-3